MHDQIALRLDADTATASISVDPALPAPAELALEARTLVSFRLPPQARRRYVFAVQPAPVVVEGAAGQFDAPVRRSDSWVTLLDRHTRPGRFTCAVHLVDVKTGQTVRVAHTIRHGA